MPIESGSMTGFMTGCGIPETIIPRETVSRVSVDIINIYQRGIDALIRQLGKDIKLIYDPTIIDCPSCDVSQQPNNRFRPGSLIHYPDGRRCPYCNGNGKTEQENSEILKVLVQMRPRDYEQFDISVQNPAALVRTKSFLVDTIKIQRAKSAIIDIQVKDVLKIKCRRLSDPIPKGLGQSRYAIVFWERI